MKPAALDSRVRGNDEYTIKNGTVVFIIVYLSSQTVARSWFK
jgi:hypothetical protein